MPMPTNIGEKEEKSKIVAQLAQGSIVSLQRNDIDYVVTEFGIASLKGKTLRQRAKALIEIADPKFKASLIEEFEKRFHCSYTD